MSRIDPDQKVEGDYKTGSNESAQPFSLNTILNFRLHTLTLPLGVLFFFQTKDEGHSKNSVLLKKLI